MPGACEAVYSGLVVAYRLTDEELVIVSVHRVPEP
jgi:hypothetical protein